MKKLIILGDSILKGVTYSENENRYKLYRDHSFASFAKSGINVVNRSKMGATVKNGIEIADKIADEIDSDTAVLIEYGGNDCDHNWQEVAKDPMGTYAPKISEKNFIESFSQLIKKIRAKGADIIVSNTIPIDADRYFKWISKNLNGENILGWLGDISMLYRWQEYYSNLCEKIALTLECRLFDIRSTFLLDHDFKKLMCADGIHPTVSGHDMIHKNLLTFCKNEI